MSRIYDNWEKLVGAVLRREKDRELAYCESFDSSSSADVSSRFSFEISFAGDVHPPAAEECRSSDQKINHSDLSSSDNFFSRSVRAIEYEEIIKMARHFEIGYVLREGSSSSVYKGWIDEHSLTATKPGVGIPVTINVKKIINSSKDVELQKKWMGEISHLRHPNLLTPIGYCFNTDKTIIVYEFIPKESLEDHLFETRPQIPWARRMKVAVGAARALNFLHGLKTPVIYGNLTIDDILLDDDFNPKLSELGFKEFDPTKCYKYEIECPFGIVSQLEFSPYAAPEYKATGQLSTKCDVYSFGVVLVQLILGLRALRRKWDGQKRSLIEWATPYLRDKKRLGEIMDSRLEGEYTHKQACKVAQLALKCVRSHPRSRPSMVEVVAALQQLQYPKVSESPRQKFDETDLSSQNIFFSRDVKAIEYEEIRKATRNFLPSNMLEEGPSCCVYKGWIDEHYAAAELGSGHAVAVKMMTNTGNLGLQQWVNEIKNLIHLRHPNLLTPIGYSFDTDTDTRISVYEFMPKGSLDKHLFIGLQLLPLPWAARIKVAVCAARALAFLHDLEVPVIYRDFRSDNILLDGDFIAKLSDIGLSEGTSRHETEAPHHIINDVGVTYPYAAPDYLATGHLSTKCNVYSFGVVLVELLSGRRALDRSRPAGEHNLMDWAKPYLGNKRQQSRIMDMKLKNEYPHKEAYEVGKIALQCIGSYPRSRPRMAEVVAALQQL